MTWSDRYIGTPFKAQGRAPFAGWDCYGLIHYLMLRYPAIRLPAHDEIEPTQHRAIARAIAAAVDPSNGDWLEVKDWPRVFDVAVMRGRVTGTASMATTHLGLVVKPGWLIHVHEGISTVHQELDDWDIRPRLRSVWRHRLLKDMSPADVVIRAAANDNAAEVA